MVSGMLVATWPLKDFDDGIPTLERPPVMIGVVLLSLE